MFGPLEIKNRTNHLAKTAEEHRQFTVSRLPKGTVWLCDTDGLVTPDYGLCILAKDIAKIGLLCLNKGQYDGRQIMPSEWIEEES